MLRHSCHNPLLKDREITKSLVQRAEAAGFSALVLTVDAPTFGRRLDDIRNDFKLPPHLQMANFAGMGAKKNGRNDQVGRVSPRKQRFATLASDRDYFLVWMCECGTRRCSGGTSSG